MRSIPTPPSFSYADLSRPAAFCRFLLDFRGRRVCGDGGCTRKSDFLPSPFLSPSIFFFDRRVIVPGKPVFFTGIANSSADVCKIVRKKTLEKRIALPPWNNYEVISGKFFHSYFPSLSLSLYIYTFIHEREPRGFQGFLVRWSDYPRGEQIERRRRRRVQSKIISWNNKSTAWREKACNLPLPSPLLDTANGKTTFAHRAINRRSRPFARTPLLRVCSLWS